jgi:hypothetical protein
MLPVPRTDRILQEPQSIFVHSSSIQPGLHRNRPESNQEDGSSVPTENDPLPKASRYRLAKKTSPYPTGNQSELPGVASERPWNTSVSHTKLTSDDLFHTFNPFFIRKSPIKGM